MFFDDKYTVVSSAKSIHWEYVKAFGKSLVYIINSRGPKTDPWGTPHVVSMRDDVMPL
jgi:hypothetical protein